MSKLLTITDLGRLLGLRPYAVNYAIQKLGIEPTGRIGIARVWSESQLPAIREAVNQTTRSKAITGRPRPKKSNVATAV
jgi:hypothetical protein